MRWPDRPAEQRRNLPKSSECLGNQHPTEVSNKRTPPQWKPTRKLHTTVDCMKGFPPHCNVLERMEDPFFLACAATNPLLTTSYTLFSADFLLFACPFAYFFLSCSKCLFTCLQPRFRITTQYTQGSIQLPYHCTYHHDNITTHGTSYPSSMSRTAVVARRR